MVSHCHKNMPLHSFAAAMPCNNCLLRSVLRPLSQEPPNKLQGLQTSANKKYTNTGTYANCKGPRSCTAALCLNRDKWKLREIEKMYKRKYGSECCARKGKATRKQVLLLSFK